MPGYKQLADRLDDLKEIPSQVAKDASVRIADLIDDGFSAGADPYGTAWAALRPATIARGRRPPPLTDDADMRGSITVKPDKSAGIVITIQSDYAKFHQTGTRNMAKRPILPDGPSLPDSWQDAIGDAMAANTRKRVK